jgi:peptidyl-prolyl cis-trans isomerase A (cyclophilin A)
MNKTILLILYTFLYSCSPLNGQSVKIEMTTAYGSIITELYPEKAPITCENFLKYIRANKLDSLHFYRVVRMDNQPHNEVKIEVVQGGLGDYAVSQFPPIAHETTKKTGILHKDGVISMARWKPGTATSEFFICIGDQPELDFGGLRNPDGQGFAAFGKVVQGMDIVKKIQQMEDQSQMLIDVVEINSIRILE